MPFRVVKKQEEEMTKAQKITLKRLTVLLEAYGADPSRWPAADRAVAENMLAGNSMASGAAAGAGKLDAALDVMPAPEKADQAFIKRLATIPFAARAAAIGAEAMPATFQDFLRGLFPAKTLIPQGVGIAMAGVLGIWLGLSTTAPVDVGADQLDASQYLLENPDLGKDLEQFK